VAGKGVLLGLAIAVAGGAWFVVRDVRGRRRVDRRAALLDVLAAAARHGRPFGPVLSCAARATKSAKRRAALELAAEQVAAGETLSDVLARVLPTEFPAPVADAIRAAEGTRRLPTTLEGLGDEATREGALAHRTAMATAYPAILGVGLLVLHLGILEGWTRYMADAVDGEGPGASSLPAARWVFLVVAGALCLPWLLRRFVPRATDGASARWLRTLATGLDAGLGLRGALRYAGGAAGERRLAAATKALSSGVDAGRPLPGLLPSLPFPARVQARLAAAEGVPSPAVLRDIADGCTRRHVERRERWIRWAVPVATVLVGIVVAIDYAVLTDLWRFAAQQARS
jgi:hypothetical protein